MAIARRIGSGMKIVIGDKSVENANAMARTMNQAGFDATPLEMDLSSRNSILHLIAEAQGYGNISMLVNAAGVSPARHPLKPFFKWISTEPPYCWKRWGKSLCPVEPG